jgi:hypothetical protein
MPPSLGLKKAKHETSVKPAASRAWRWRRHISLKHQLTCKPRQAIVRYEPRISLDRLGKCSAKLISGTTFKHRISQSATSTLLHSEIPARSKQWIYLSEMPDRAPDPTLLWERAFQGNSMQGNHSWGVNSRNLLNTEAKHDRTIKLIAD